MTRELKPENVCQCLLFLLLILFFHYLHTVQIRSRKRQQMYRKSQESEPVKCLLFNKQHAFLQPVCWKVNKRQWASMASQLADLVVEDQPLLNYQRPFSTCVLVCTWALVDLLKSNLTQFKIHCFPDFKFVVQSLMMYWLWYLHVINSNSSWMIG